MSNYVPLQSHGLKKTKQIWKPPKSHSRFWSATKEDEFWMRPLVSPGDGGKWGTLETVPDERYPVDLYDVRDERGELIGYSEMNPVEYLEFARGMPLQLLVVGTEGLNYCLSKPVEEKYKSVEVHTLQWSAGGSSRERFLCWSVPLHYALRLVETGWIKCIGPDRKNEFFHEVRMKASERAFRMGYDRRFA